MLLFPFLGFGDVGDANPVHFGQWVLFEVGGNVVACPFRFVCAQNVYKQIVVWVFGVWLPEIERSVVSDFEHDGLVAPPILFRARH